MNIVKIIPRLSRRPQNSHKGNFGKVLVVAGSRGMTGAAFLAAKGALRAGAGLVLVATPKSQQPILAAKLTCAITYSLPETNQGTLSSGALPQLTGLARNHDVIALGPGISQHPQTVKLVLSILPRFCVPVVIDADGLNALSRQPGILKKIKTPLILTPHPGEMTRLSGLRVGESINSRIKIATEFAKKYNVIVTLKGYQTIVTDGTRVYINHTGNPGMATGGSGDVLTGIIAALVGQGLKPFEAAQLGVYLHGIAADLAVRQIGEISMIASDLLDYLPEAFAKLTYR